MGVFVSLVVLVGSFILAAVCPTCATTGFELEVLLGKLDYIQYKLFELEDGMKRNEEAISRLQADSKLLLASTKGPFGSCRTEPTKVSGRYVIQSERNKHPSEVYCEQKSFGGGWIVLQRRFNGSENFLRNWTDYRDGFGDLDGEFWLGLESIHRLTSQSTYELLVEVKDFQGSYGYVHYDKFEVEAEAEAYRLKVLGKYSGTAGDSMRTNENMKFSTHDRDNDSWSDESCATDSGGWWYWACTYANLNGYYRNTTYNPQSLIWYNLKDDWRGLAYSRMMIREQKTNLNIV